MKLIIRLIILTMITFSCQKQVKQEKQKITKEIKDTFKLFSQPSVSKNTYLGFDSPKAINHIAEIENQYFNDLNNGASIYYGTQWLENLIINGDTTTFKKYTDELNGIPVPLHCTHYALAALKVGMKEEFLS